MDVGFDATGNSGRGRSSVKVARFEGQLYAARIRVFIDAVVALCLVHIGRSARRSITLEPPLCMLTAVAAAESTQTCSVVFPTVALVGDPCRIRRETNGSLRTPASRHPWYRSCNGCTHVWSLRCSRPVGAVTAAALAQLAYNGVPEEQAVSEGQR